MATTPTECRAALHIVTDWPANDTPLDAARRSEAADLAKWLEAVGGKPAADLTARAATPETAQPGTHD